MAGGPTEHHSFSDQKLAPISYAQLTSLSTAAGLGTIPDGAVFALLQAEGDDLRWRDDGTAPTDSVGMRLEQDRDYYYPGDLSAIQFIEENGSGKLNIAFYGYPS